MPLTKTTLSVVLSSTHLALRSESLLVEIPLLLETLDSRVLILTMILVFSSTFTLSLPQLLTLLLVDLCGLVRQLVWIKREGVCRVCTIWKWLGIGFRRMQML